VRLRAARRARPDTAAREEPRPEEDSGPRRRKRWFTGPSATAALVTALSVAIAVAVTPAAGAAGHIADGFARAVRQMASSSHSAQPLSGTPAVGALFTSSAGALGSHFCSASVISSPHGDLIITAAHCASSTTSAMVFVPGYDHGSTPYGVWTVTKIYEDQSWKSSADPDDDAAILQVSQPGSIVPIEDVTGAEQLIPGTAVRQLVEVIGYPDTSDGPIACRNWTSEPMADQLEFDCGGYTDGTSGGPFLADVNSATGQGTVIGVIGGYEQGGNTPQVSYSSVFGANVAGLYSEAVAGG
jgi:V8-like Glu-specific endopeptidase